jgi:hypothetical protein
MCLVLIQQLVEMLGEHTFGKVGTAFRCPTALAEITCVMREAFPEIRQCSLVEIMCRLVAVAIEVRRKTNGKGLLDLIEIYAGHAALSRAASANNLRC